MKPIVVGLIASFFFAVTFVLNRLMSDSGGYWIWSASLRYLFMFPMLLALVYARRGLKPLAAEMRRRPWQWAWWSFIGFGLFYAPLCFAAAYSPAWLVAGTWQFTIIAGSLLSPLFQMTMITKNGPVRVRKRIPFKGMGMSLVILLGIGLMEWSQAAHASLKDLLLGTIPVLLATFAYPLGNRKMMELCADKLDAYQRTLGMTAASLPFWLILSCFQMAAHGLPSGAQSTQALIVALFSGVIATVLFFSATDMAKGDVQRLASVEATQSGEVVFTLIGEWLFLAGTTISATGLLGVGLVVLGMILHSLRSAAAGPVALKAPGIDQT